MFKHLIKGLLADVALKLLDNCRHLSRHLLKIEVAKSYLRGVQVARWSALGLLRMGLAIGLVCFGVLLFHAGLFILLPWSLKAKAIVGLLLGAAYAVSGGIALRALVDERTWMDKSGASELLEEALGQSNKA